MVQAALGNSAVIRDLAFQDQDKKPGLARRGSYIQNYAVRV